MGVGEQVPGAAQDAIGLDDDDIRVALVTLAELWQGTDFSDLSARQHQVCEKVVKMFPETGPGDGSQFV